MGFEAQWPHLMRLAQGGDRAAYETLMREIAPVLKKYFMTRVRDAARADDFVQDTILRVHLSRQTYDPALPFEPWMFAIARNVMARRGGKEAALAQRLVLAHVDEDVGGTEAATQEEELALKGALAQLGASQRETIRLLKIEGLSIEEAAAREGTTVAAFKVRAHRAYKALKQVLGMKERDDDE